MPVRTCRFASSTLLGLMLGSCLPPLASASEGTARGPGDSFVQLQESERVAIGSVAARTILALRRTDADDAYAEITANAHRQFPSKDRYLAALLERFSPLAYATWFELGELRQTSLGTVQLVRFTDRRGKHYLAFFACERGITGWKLSGIVMVESPSEPI